MRPSRARIHGADAETPAVSARIVRGNGEMGACPARTDMSRSELNPSTGQLADVPPRIDRETEAMHSRIAGTLSALASNEGLTAGIVAAPHVFTAMRRECMAVVAHCIRVPREFLRVTLE